MTFMGHEVRVPVDLRLQLEDGRWVEFLCPHSSGEIINGRLASEAKDADDTPSP